ncbi:MAG: PEP-CTERM sorting domain-containing protein [Verrucomicrobiota bacterium]
MKSKLLSLPALAVTALLGLALPTQGQISLVNTFDSGNLTSTNNAGNTGTNDSFSTTYDNMGANYMAVVLTVVSVNNLNLPSNGTGVSVTFAGTPVTIASAFDSGYSNNSFWSAIYLLESPAAGSGTFDFNFNANITDPADDATSSWRLGIFSLDGVDLSNPVLVTDLMSTGGETYSDPALSAGDFFIQGQAAFNTIGAPNYQTPEDSAQLLYDAQSVNGTRTYQAEFGTLVAGDVVGDSVLFDPKGTTTRGSARRPTVIFNAIPEPTSAALLFGAVGLLALRRRR